MGLPKEFPPEWVIVVIVICVIITHYIFPAIHYICIRICQSKVSNGDVENQYAVNKPKEKRSPKLQKSACRVFSIHLTFWTYAWIIFFIVTAAVGDGQIQPAGTKLVLNIIGYINLPVMVIFLWIETFFSWEYNYLGHVLERKSCKTYLKELVEEKPAIQVIVETYHSETRGQPVSYGGTIEYDERVYDHVQTFEFPVSRWEDASDDVNMLNMKPKKMTRLKIYKHITFADEKTKEKFDQTQAELDSKLKAMYPKSVNKIKADDSMADSHEYVCAYWDKSDKTNWWINKYVFVVVSFFLFSWFYRIVFSLTSQTACYSVVKKIHAS